MICPECQKEGKKSIVFIGVSSTTLLAVTPYYDEEGRFHFDDPNTTTTQYTCSNGHVWSENFKGGLT